MIEVWVKKTIYRRYLVEDCDIAEVAAILKSNIDSADELIRDTYDRNNEIEYDNEVLITPIEYTIRKEQK